MCFTNGKRCTGVAFGSDRAPTTRAVLEFVEDNNVPFTAEEEAALVVQEKDDLEEQAEVEGSTIGQLTKFVQRKQLAKLALTPATDDGSSEQSHTTTKDLIQFEAEILREMQARHDRHEEQSKTGSKPFDPSGMVSALAELKPKAKLLIDDGITSIWPQVAKMKFARCSFCFVD
jgi:hypothetical protein